MGEGHAIRLRRRRAVLALAEAALERMRAGKATAFDRIRWKSLEQLQAHVAFERGVVEIEEGY